MSMSRTVSRFDLQASTYEDSALQELLFVPAHQAALRLGRRWRPEAGAVLDVGCGTGRLLRAARPAFPAADLVGIDPAGQMVATAVAMTPIGLGIRYLQARAERLPFPDARFDLVVATLSLRPWADVPAGVAEVARVIGPGGMLVVADVFPSGTGRASGGRVVRRRRPAPAPAELAPVLAEQRLEVAAAERVRWFGLPDVQVLGLQPGARSAVQATGRLRRR
jgi:ubiquinone/menaquinone biosynthesis C-methylase UbiE